MRPSVFIPLSAPDFATRSAEVYEEHVDGFKKRKRPRTEADNNMEWRQRLKAKTAAAQDDTASVAALRSQAVERYKKLQRPSATGGPPANAFLQSMRARVPTRVGAPGS